MSGALGSEGAGGGAAPPTGTGAQNTPALQEAASFAVSRRDITYASIVAFLAWVFSVYDYILFGILLPPISEDFGWNAATSTRIATYVAVGTFIVALAVGPVVDLLGRKKAMVLTTAGAAISSGLTSLTPGSLYLVIVRAFSGLGYSEQAVNSAYLNEMYEGQKGRGFAYSLVQGGWPVGVLFASAMAAVLLPIVGWRGTFLVATFPAIVIVVLAVKLRESPRWARMNQIKKLEREGRAEDAAAVAREYNVVASEKSTLAQVFGPDVRRHTFFLSGSFLLNWVGVQVFAVLGTTVLTEGKGVSFSSSLLLLILSNAVAYVGYLTHGKIGDRIGRRETIAFGWMISGVCYTVMLFGPDAYVFTVVMYSAGLFFLIGPYAALLFYMGESFPARIRGTGASVVNAMGPLGAILGSALLSAALSAGLEMRSAAALVGALAIVLSGLLLFGARRISPDEVVV